MKMRPVGQGVGSGVVVRWWRLAVLLPVVVVGMAGGLAAQVVDDRGTVEFQERTGWEFRQDGVRFSNDFSGARLNGVKRTRARSYELTISPENHPINNSAWYAFKIEANRAVTVTLTLSYDRGRHRYAPKVSRDGASWVELPADEVKLRGRDQATFSLRLQPGTVWVAGQPLITWEDQQAWIEALAGPAGAAVRTFGTSVQGRPLRVLESRVPGAGEAAPTIVITTGQHPPETSSVIAFRAFIEALLADTPAARDLRARVNLMVFPNLNPDGWRHGHWRSNANAVDLNRTWLGEGTEQGHEVRQVIAELRARQGLIGFIDFHSTNRDVHYTGGDDEAEPQWFVAGLIDGLNARLERHGEAPIPRSVTRGNRGSNSQHWGRRELGVASFIWEWADDAPGRRMQLGGVEGAAALMELVAQHVPVAAEAAPAPAP